MPVSSADDLYGLPLDQFVAERAALVKALRGAGKKDEAAAVASLRKPSVAAWAVNQLVRTQRKALDALFSAGEELADTQSKAVAGKGSSEALRDAARRQREALAELLKAAEGLLSSEGQSLGSATLDRVGDSFRAASLDERARNELKDGRLARELSFSGLGPVGQLPPTKNEPDVSDEQAAAALKSARQTEREARRAAAQAGKALAAARHRRDAIATALREADEQLARAEARSESAATDLQTAEAAVSELS